MFDGGFQTLHFSNVFAGDERVGLQTNTIFRSTNHQTSRIRVQMIPTLVLGTKQPHLNETRSRPFVEQNQEKEIASLARSYLFVVYLKRTVVISSSETSKTNRICGKKCPESSSFCCEYNL